VPDIGDVAGGGDLSLLHQVTHPVEKGHDVVAAQEPQVDALVRPVQPQAFGEPDDAVDLRLHRPAWAGAPVPGSVVDRPVLRGSAQPRLTDLLEV
jgi:hypothetical protein